MNKKAVSPIIATILIVIIVVIAGVGLLNFGKDFQDKKQQQTDQLSSTFNKEIEIQKVIQKKISIKNKLKKNISISKLEINGVNCDIYEGKEELSTGINYIDLKYLDCSDELYNTGKKNLFIQIEDLILTDKFNLKEKSSLPYTFNPSTGFCDSKFKDSGNGSSSNPHLICDRNSLSNIRNNLNLNFLLVKNIDLEGSSSNPWDPIGNTIESFAGNFNGSGFLISNLYVNTSGIYGGLFGVTSSGSSIKNIGVKTIYINSNGSSGGLVGKSFSTISNSYVINIDSIIFSVSSSGGLVGVSLLSPISNSYAINTNSNIYSSSSSYSGGLVGVYASSSISNSYAINNNSNISGPYVGGFIGYSSQTNILNSSVSWLGNSNSINGTTKEILLGFKSGGTLTNSKYYNESPIIGDPSTTYGTNFSSKPNFYTNNENTSFIYDNWDFIDTWKFNTNDYPTLR